MSARLARLGVLPGVLLLLAVAASPGFGGAATEAPPGGDDFTVRSTGSSLAVDARNADLSKVLGRLAQETGVPIFVLDLPSTPVRVSVIVADQGAGDAIRAVLKAVPPDVPLTYVFSYRRGEGGERLTGVVVRLGEASLLDPSATPRQHPLRADPGVPPVVPPLSDEDKARIAEDLRKAGRPPEAIERHLEMLERFVPGAPPSVPGGPGPIGPGIVRGLPGFQPPPLPTPEEEQRIRESLRSQGVPDETITQHLQDLRRKLEELQTRPPLPEGAPPEPPAAPPAGPATRPPTQ